MRMRKYSATTHISAAVSQAAAIAARSEGWAFLVEPNRSAPFYVPETDLLVLSPNAGEPMAPATAPAP